MSWHLGAVARDHVVDEVDLEVADLQCLCGFVGLTAPGASVSQGHAEPGLELGHPEGLRDEVVRSGVEGLDLAAFVAVGREHQNRHSGELADASGDLNAVDVGEAKVEDHQIRPRQCDLRDGLSARLGQHDLVAACA